MAKKSSIEKNNRRKRLAQRYAASARRCKAVATDEAKSAGGALPGAAEARRAAAQLGADAHPQPLRDHRPPARRITASSSMSRIALRDLGSKGLIPGLVKSSW